MAFYLFSIYKFTDSNARFDYAQEYPVAIAEMGKGLVDGSIQRRFHIVDGGIEEAPRALPMLFSGGNTGKLYVNMSSHYCIRAKFVLQSRKGGGRPQREAMKSRHGVCSIFRTREACDCSLAINPLLYDILPSTITVSWPNELQRAICLLQEERGSIGEEMLSASSNSSYLAPLSPYTWELSIKSWESCIRGVARGRGEHHYNMFLSRALHFISSMNVHSGTARLPWLLSATRRL